MGKILDLIKKYGSIIMDNPLIFSDHDIDVKLKEEMSKANYKEQENEENE